MKIRSKLKRAVSSILALVMILSTFPTIAFAAPKAPTDEYVGGGDGDEIFTNGSEWRANWNSNQVGIRVSIVNHDGENMLINRETGKPYVVDLLFSEPKNIGVYLKGNNSRMKMVTLDRVCFPSHYGSLTT